jgi:hypothetical protein
MVNALSCLPLWFQEGDAFFEAKEPRKVTEYTERVSLEASGASNPSRSPCRASVPSPWGEGQDEGEPLNPEKPARTSDCMKWDSKNPQIGFDFSALSA